MAHHDIQVTLSASNRVTVNPNSQPARSSHTVRWICSQGALRITFNGSESPLRSGALTLTAPDGDTGVQPLRRTSKQRFKYTAEVTPASGGGPFSVDPELVIADGGGQSSTKKSGGAAKKKPGGSAKKTSGSAKKKTGKPPAAKKKATKKK